MTKISASQRLILDKTIFIESFDTLLTETQAHRGALRGDLMFLLNSGFLEAYDQTTPDHRKAPFCDMDHLEQYAFRATTTGLRALKT